MTLSVKKPDREDYLTNLIADPISLGCLKQPVKLLNCFVLGNRKVYQ